MVALGWFVLLLVFVDEVLAVAAAAVWGAWAGGPVLAVAAGLAVVAVWWAFASPKAPYGGAVARPVVKALVFGLASLGLWQAGHPRLGAGAAGVLGGWSTRSRCCRSSVGWCPSPPR